MTRSGTSPIHMTARMPTNMMRVVPRSDCVRYRNRTGMRMSTAACTNKSRVASSPARKRSRMRAPMRMNAILANSEGCRLMNPSESQRCAPSPTVPMTATSTSMPTASPHTAQMSGPLHTS